MLYHEESPRGHAIRLDGLSSGLLFAHLKTNGRPMTGKFLHVRQAFSMQFLTDFYTLEACVAGQMERDSASLQEKLPIASHEESAG